MGYGEVWCGGARSGTVWFGCDGVGSGPARHGRAGRGRVRQGMVHLAGGQLATVGLPVGAARWGTAWRDEERLGLAGYGEELATAAKRLAAVVYPMGSGAVGRGTAWHGVVR